MDDSYKNEKWHPRYGGLGSEKPVVLPGAVIDCGKWANNVNAAVCDSSGGSECLFDIEEGTAFRPLNKTTILSEIHDLELPKMSFNFVFGFL